MKKLCIAKQPKYVDIGDGFYVNKVGLDPNGNSSVWVSKGSGRAKKIQMTNAIPNKSDIMSDKLKFFQDKNDPDTKKSIEAIKEYYRKHLMKANLNIAMDAKIIKDKLMKEFNEVSDNITALNKEIKKSDIDKGTVSQMISWSIEALNKASSILSTLDSNSIKK